MSTTTANAYVQPITRKYLETIETRLRQMHYRRRLYLMLSSGGIAGGQTAKEFPIRMLESGPTAGASRGSITAGRWALAASSRSTWAARRLRSRS